MKFRGVGALPSSVALWLEQQLEERGIDSGIYSRYVLGLLHRQPIDQVDLPPYKAVDLDGLVDELCVKLREASSTNNGDRRCLNEKNTELTPSSKYSPSDTSSKLFFDLISPKERNGHFNHWIRPQPNVNRRARRRGYSETSPRANKKKEINKENVCVGVMRGRMRSRSTVKQSGCPSYKMRSSAKSLDRNESGAVVKFVKGEMKGKKFSLADEKERKCSPITGQMSEIGDFDKNLLPMDFQQLLQSPVNSSLFRQPKQHQPPPNFIQCGTNITSSIWSDTSSEKMDEDEVPPPWETSSKWSEARSSILSSAWKLPFVFEKDVETTSLALTNDDSSFFSFFGNPAPNLLKHNENSGFSEVTPGSRFEKKKVQEVNYTQADSQEEDLLTSMKTHFRPIKDDGSKLGYKDGSSFPISTNFSHVKYRRSESGALYLDPGNKYYEFKRSNDTSAFVPKFKVCKTEKFCQTEDMSVVEDEVTSSRVEISDGEELSEAKESEDEQFYFPGDEELVEEMLNCSEDDEDEEGASEEVEPSCIQFSGWVTAWPVSAAIWSNDTLNNNNNHHNTWVLEGANKQLGTGAKADVQIGNSEQYTRLRDELFEDGEELLSDLSSFHLFLDPDRVDDPNLPKAQVEPRSNTCCQLPYTILKREQPDDQFFWEKTSV